MLVFRSVIFNLVYYSVTFVFGFSGAFMVILPRAILAAHSRVWVRSCFFLMRKMIKLDHRLIGTENILAGPAVYAIKHQSAWDTLAFLVFLRDPVVIIKRELFFVPFYGLVIWRLGMIKIDRAGGSAALRKVVTESQAALAAGRPVVIFPQGTRTPPGKSNPYLPGVAALYRQLGTPVVPVALNSGMFWAKGYFVKKPGTILVSFLKPIAPGLSRRKFLDQLEHETEQECRHLEAG